MTCNCSFAFDKNYFLHITLILTLKRALVILIGKIFIVHKYKVSKNHWSCTGPKVAFPLAGHKYIHICTWHFMSTSHLLPAWHITFPATCHMEEKESNPLHLTDAGRIIFPLSVLNMTQSFMLQDLCSTGAWHVDILPTPPSPLPLYFTFTCTHIL